MSKNLKFCRWKGGGRSETDGRMFASRNRMTWNYDDNKCRCGLVGTEKHVLFECTLYGEERGRWRGAVRDLKDGMVWRNMK